MIIAIPVGPVAVICIKRAIYYGVPGGISAGMGAAAADAFFGAVAGFGIATVSHFLIQHEHFIRGAGGLILVMLGIVFFLFPGEPPVKGASRAGLAGTFLTTFMLTLTNPITIITFLTVFASLGLAGQTMNYGTAGLLVAGVFLGSAIWWLGISLTVLLARGRIGVAWMPQVKRWSGLLILTFGIYALWDSVSYLIK
ncbi:MAG: LysE family transporter [Rhodospirillales bacterium]|nr:LysE family transporter [Rhodospirillales bacterium]